jgi:NADH dehydrogenase
MPAAPLRFDVIIAGGGFAGVYCAKALARELGDAACQRVALIAEQNFMVFQPMLAEVVGSSISPRHVVNPIRLLCSGVTVLRGAIQAIDLEKRVLRVNAGDFTGAVEVGFTHLVLGLGGIVDVSRVPGMAEHAFLMKNVGDALRLREAIIGRFEEANLEDNADDVRRLLTFVVVGGGFSGVETAGQILDLAREMARFYPRLAPDAARVVLVHSRERLLPELSESLAKYCEENMRARGTEIILNARVSAMTAGKVFLGEGRAIESRTVVSTVGNAPHPMLVELCKGAGIASEKGRIVTDATMRVPGRDALWAAGDCAAVPMPASVRSGTGAPVAQDFSPPTAQFAMRQGTLLGKNIARALTGRADLQPFAFKGLGELAAIGHRSAVAEILGMKFSGFFAWWLWRSVYLAKLPGLDRKLRVMIDWTLDLFFPRDIAIFQASPTRVLQQNHLEPGDVLCHVGEPVFSMYFVKAGRIELRGADGAVQRVIAAGQHFGKQAILHDKVWPFTAVAVEASEVVALSARAFRILTGANVQLPTAPKA